MVKYYKVSYAKTILFWESKICSVIMFIIIIYTLLSLFDHWSAQTQTHITQSVKKQVFNVEKAKESQNIKCHLSLVREWLKIILVILSRLIVVMLWMKFQPNEALTEIKTISVYGEEFINHF